MMSDKELFNLYVVPNRCYIQSVICSCTKHNTDLIYSDVLEYLYKNIHTYNPDKSKIKVWLYVVVKRRCVLLLDKAKKMPYSDVLDDYLIRTGSTDALGSIETLEDFRTKGKLLLSDRLYNALASLNTNKLEVIIYHSNGYTFDAMSDVLNVNTETLKARFYVGIKEAIQAYKSNGVVQSATPQPKSRQNEEKSAIYKYINGTVRINNKNWRLYFSSYKDAQKAMEYM